MEIVRPFLVKKSPRTPEVIHSTSHFARYVGLSRSAVSRVLNNRRGLLPETVERVHRAMAETGFTPNAHARHLRGARTSVGGICIENFLTPTAISKLSALQQHLDACGYVAVTEVSRQGIGDKVVRHFRSLRVDGVIFVGHFQPKELDAWIGELTRHGTPHVVVDSSGLQSARTVTIDRVAAMRVVMDHLLDLGHRRFALLGLSGGFQTVAERLRGVHEALVARDIRLGEPRDLGPHRRAVAAVVEGRPVRKPDAVERRHRRQGDVVGHAPAA